MSDGGWIRWGTFVMGMACAVAAFWNPIAAFPAFVFGFQFGWSVTALDYRRRARLSSPLTNESR